MLKVSPEKFFVYCALIFGIILITIIPPFQSPDEDSHFKKAYVVSKGQLFPSSQDGVVGYELPTDIVQYISEGYKSYSEVILNDKTPQDYSETVFKSFSTVETTPFVYIAPSIGIVFAKVTTKLIGMDNISIVTMLQFARFFCLILYVFLVYLAIKTTPILKKHFALLDYFQ